MKGERRVDHKTRALTDVIKHHQRRSFWLAVGLVICAIVLAAMPAVIYFAFQAGGR